MYAECHYTKCPHAEWHHVECHYAQSRYRGCHYTKCHYAECHHAKCPNAKLHYVECHYTKCHYAECHYADCHGAKNSHQNFYDKSCVGRVADAGASLRRVVEGVAGRAVRPLMLRPAETGASALVPKVPGSQARQPLKEMGTLKVNKCRNN